MQGVYSPEQSSFHAVSRELLTFGIDNRLRAIVQSGRSQGTPHERFTDGLVDTIADILVRYANEARIRQTVAGYSRHHLAGQKSFFSGEWAP